MKDIIEQEDTELTEGRQAILNLCFLCFLLFKKRIDKSTWRRTY
jgi:hypothetical protein